MAQVVSLQREPEPQLGDGLHAGRVEAPQGTGFRVRSLAGESHEAVPAPGVERELIEECMRSNQLVILVRGQQEVLIIGSLQTHRSWHREPDGTLSVEAKRLQLRAEDSVLIESRASSLRLESKGNVRLNGHRMTIDVDTRVRVLSALVELP